MSLHEKHRERMDKRIRDQRLYSLAEHEQLEFILYNVFQQGDTNELAHKLLKKFGNISRVLKAEYDQLIEVEGVGNRTAMFLTNLREILGIVDRARVMPDSKRFDKVKETVDYVRTYFYGKHHEEVFLFSLNGSYRLLNVTRVSDGVGGEAYIYPAKLVRQALKDEASAVVIVHNHPGGDANPSAGDIIFTENIKKAFDAVEIHMLDSIVVTEKDYFSIREKGYLDFGSDRYCK